MSASGRCLLLPVQQWYVVFATPAKHDISSPGIAEHQASRTFSSHGRGISASAGVLNRVGLSLLVGVEFLEIAELVLAKLLPEYSAHFRVRDA